MPRFRKNPARGGAIEIIVVQATVALNRNTLEQRRYLILSVHSKIYNSSLTEISREAQRRLITCSMADSIKCMNICCTCRLIAVD